MCKSDSLRASHNHSSDIINNESHVRTVPIDSVKRYLNKGNIVVSLRSGHLCIAYINPRTLNLHTIFMGASETNVGS